MKGQIQQSKALDQIKKTQIMVANLKAERVPQLTVANTVDVIRAADLPCIAGMSENLNYFDMSSLVSSVSLRCTQHARVNPHL